jgi:hypothetical protein
MTGPWTKLMSGALTVLMIATDHKAARINPFCQLFLPPSGASKHTVAQDQRAAAKRRAVKKAKAKGQTRPARLTNRARHNARRQRWAA